MRALFNLGDYCFFTLAPEMVTSSEASEGDDAHVKLYEANARIVAGSWELEYGVDSMWWGPGKHGALLMTNNAPPFEGLLKVATHEPVILPVIECPMWVTVFSTILDEARLYPEPIFAGMRIELRPFPQLTVGLSRTALFGGKGRDTVDLEAIWDVFWASEENATGGPGNQLAGIDLAYRFRAGSMPLEIYLEAAGEDESLGLPYKLAFVAGLHVPMLPGLPDVSLRLEWATTAFDGEGVWYVHGTSGQAYAYTYEGMVIGHHMGTDAEDLYFGVDWRVLPGLNAGLYFDYERHGVLQSATESLDEFGFHVEWDKGEKYALRGTIAWQEYDNFEMVGGATFEGYRGSVSVRVQW
jgi:hypothetical protein